MALATRPNPYKMKLTAALLLGVLVLMSIWAWRMVPPSPGGDRTTLIWVTDNNPVRQAQVDLFNELNPDLYLVIDPSNLDQQKVIVQSLGGVGPDLFDSYSAEMLDSYVRSGIAMDVTDEMLARGIDVAAEIWPVLHTSTIQNGRAYGFPRNASANAVWFNKDVFDEAGVPYPKDGWTWDDLISTAKKLTVRDDRGRPSQFGIYWDWNGYPDLILQFGGRQFTPDGTECIIDSPEATGAIQLARDLMYKHRVSPTPAEEAALSTSGGWGSGGMTFLMSGRVAMAYGGRWWLNLMRKEENLRLGVVAIPYQKRKVGLGYGGITIINSKSPRAKEAVRVLEYFAGKQFNELNNDQADGISPVRKYAYTDRFLFNPEYPQEQDNHVWREILEIGEPLEFTQFLKGADMAPLRNQLDLVKGDLKPVPAAMKAAARDTNKRIQRNIRLKPHLARLYAELKGERPNDP